MTPQEKAKELIERFFEVQIQDINALPRAKQCALICVDEILDLEMNLSSYIYGEELHNYWQKVKQEIEQL